MLTEVTAVILSSFIYFRKYYMVDILLILYKN